MTTENNDQAIAGNQQTKTVSITRIFDLPLDTVWKAWTEPESFKKWWGPTDFSCTSCTIDFRVGGKNLANMRGPDGKEIWGTGTYKEIKPRQKIVYDDNFSDEKGNTVPPSYYDMPGEWPGSVVTVTFEEVNGETKMRLEHEGIPEEMYNDCIAGWQESLDKLQNNVR
ncbi:MAG: SRPBCC domain-containing protein [Bacteroidota bacterium]